MAQRQRWGSRLGIIFAVAGSAVGLGNFLRFPVQAANNGGGAFLIPYFISLLLLGIPLMWIEWTLGRYGGGFGHGTAPGIFHTMWQKNRFIKYFGIIGIFGPLVIFIYYTFIESWTLGYSFFSLAGSYADKADQGSMQSFLRWYQGLDNGGILSFNPVAYAFFLVTFGINLTVVYFGIRGGIEKICKIALPFLFVMGLLLMVRVLTLGTPDLLKPGWNVLNGLGFLWNPDWSSLKSAKVWLAAAGQIFFTLSVGIGVILTYASYLRKEDDVVLSGLTSVGMNEMVEIIMGGSIVITAAFVFFGPVGIREIAGSGAFNLSFVTIPVIFQKVSFGPLFGFLWFFLLFVAGVTSSISLAQPVIAFLEDEFRISRRRAVIIFGSVAFVLCQPAVLLLGKGAVDEFDFWGGTFSLVVFATIETILFGWVFGMENAWTEIHHGAQLDVPPVYRFIIKYVTPLFLIVILGWWFIQDWVPMIAMKSVSATDRPFIIGFRVLLLLLFGVLVALVNIAWRKRAVKGAGV
jgi:neurotransmitter:Na+ symporter, NSS family